jgi:hypothetical protein
MAIRENKIIIERVRRAVSQVVPMRAMLPAAVNKAALTMALMALRELRRRRDKDPDLELEITNAEAKNSGDAQEIDRAAPGLERAAQDFDQVAMTPHTCGAFTDYSRRLLLQSSIDVAFVRRDLARMIAQENRSSGAPGL